jgi:ankyrin repeat protein
MAAVVGGNLTVVQLLINNGARVKAKRADSSTALIFAAQGGHYDIVKLLCESGSGKF